MRFESPAWLRDLGAWMRGLIWHKGSPDADYSAAALNVRAAFAELDGDVKIDEYAAKGARTLTAYIELLSAAYVHATKIDPRDAVIVYQPSDAQGLQHIYITHQKGKG